MMNTPYFRSSANASTLKKTKKKKQSSSIGTYFRTSAREDSDSSRNGAEDDGTDSDDDRSVVSQGSAASVRSSLGNAASNSVRLLKKTATMPVVLAAKTTKTVARKSYQAGAAVVQGTSQAVVNAGNAVGQGGKALAHGTTAVVVGSSKALVGGTTAVVKGSSKAIVGGTTAVVKGSSKVIVGGTTAVVKGSSKVLVGGTTALVGGTTAVTRKTVRGLQHGASHMRPGRRASRRNSQKASTLNQVDLDVETLEEILQPGSGPYQALSNSQRKLLHRMKKMLLKQGPQLSSGVASGGQQTAACLPVDLVQMEQRQQKMQRRYSNASSVGNASLLHHETGSVYSEASYILQEYGGIKNPTALLSTSESGEFDEDDLLDMTNTSDLSMSIAKEDGFLMARLPNSPVKEESESDALDAVEPSEQNRDENSPENREATTSSPAASKIAPLPSDVDARTATASARKTQKKKKTSQPPTVTITLKTTEMKRNRIACTEFLPQEYQQMGGPEEQRAVFEALCWEKLASWDYNIFDLDRLTNGNALLFVGWAILGAPYAQYAMAHACGLQTQDDSFVGYPFVDKLNIPPQKLIQYLRVIQQDYHAENPYHNAIHAADVLQTVHSMIQMALESDAGNAERDEDDATTTAGFFVRSCPHHLKLFSILLAAVVHDVDHPGRNNAFHTRLKSELAIVYSDKSVLENWHIAHAFARMLGLDILNRPSQVLTGAARRVESRTNHKDCDCNLLCNATEEDFSAIRNMMIQAILQTDMTKHFAIVTDLKNMMVLINDEEKSVGPMDHDDDRTWPLLTFMLHQADISGQAKTDPLFLNWTDRCQQEFFDQGDEEAALGMSPISPYCDRKTTNQAVAQTGFVEFVVQPSYVVLGEYIPRIRKQVLPIIRENLDFWYDASGKARNDDEIEEDK